MARELAVLRTIDELLYGIDTDEEQPLTLYAERIRTLVTVGKHGLAWYLGENLGPNEQLQARTLAEGALGKLSLLLERLSEELQYHQEMCDGPDSDDILTGNEVITAPIRKEELPTSTEPVELGHAGANAEEGVDDITSSATAVNGEDSVPSPRAVPPPKEIPAREGKWYSTKNDLKVRIKSPEVTKENDNTTEEEATSPLPSERSANTTVRNDTELEREENPMLKTQIEKDWNQDGDLGDLVLSQTVQIGGRTVQLINDEYESDLEKQDSTTLNGNN